MFFPAIAVLNQYLLGDTVLVEPIARELAISECAYVVSNYPELFAAHPMVHGVRSCTELPPETRVIDLSRSIRSIEKIEGSDDRVTLPDKFANMCKEAGFSRPLDAPKLYLNGAEWTEVETHKSWHTGPCVGIIWSSQHSSKNWIYMLQAIRKLAKRGYNIFIFAENLSAATRLALPKGIYHITGRLPLRDLMKRIAMMDVMVGPDTGPMHIAGALGVPIVVVCYTLFEDLYTHYPNSRLFTSSNFKLEMGITGVAINPVVGAVAELLDQKSRVHIAPDHAPAVIKQRREAVVRIRGFGDLLTTLPAIATMRSMNGNRDHVKLTFITSKGGKVLLECTDLFDDVIGVEYDHSTSGLPLPPPDLDYREYTSVVNMINKIDFIPDSSSVPRTELFARLLGVDNIDFSLPGWRIKVPEKWKQSAWRILEANGISEKDKIIAFQVDAKGLSRRWPKVRAREFSGMACKHGFKVILLSDQFHSKCGKYAINLTGELSVSEYIGMIAISTIGLSPDSALVHIAGAMDKPAVGLFGSVDPQLRIAHYDSIYPVVGKAKCVPCNDWQRGSCRHEKRCPTCMWNIKAGEVLSKIEEVVKAGGVS